MQTLLWEAAVQMRGHPSAIMDILDDDTSVPLANIFIQVGGGALGSGLVHAARRLVASGIFPQLPRFEAVQAVGNPPVVNAIRKIRASGLSITKAVANRDQ